MGFSEGVIMIPLEGSKGPYINQPIIFFLFFGAQMLSIGDLFWGIWWNPTPNAPHPVGISGPLISSDFHATETFWIGQEVNKNQSLWTQASKSPMRNYRRRTLCPKGEGLFFCVIFCHVHPVLKWNLFPLWLWLIFSAGLNIHSNPLVVSKATHCAAEPHGSTRSPEDLDVAIQCGDPQ